MGARYSISLFQRRLVTYLLLLVGCILTLAFGAVSVSYLTGQTAHAAPTDWTTFLGSNARTGYNSAETTNNSANASSLNVHRTTSTTRNALITTEVMAANGML